MNKLILTFSIVIVLLLTAIPSVYFYLQYQKSQAALGETKAIAENDVATIVKRVGMHVELPTGEEPTVAAVNDVNQLKNQPFFAKAKNGDKVLVYRDAKKAILYDPVNDRVREIGPVTIDATASAKNVAGATTTSAPTPTPFPVALVNGTNVTNLTSIAETDLLRATVPLQVVVRSFGKRTDYPRNFVVDLSGRSDTQAREIAWVMGAPVQALPDEEKDLLTSFGNAQVAVFLGVEYANRVIPPAGQ